MHRFIELLKEYPSLGILSSFGAALQAFMRTSSPVVQYIGLIIGVAIGMITLVIKVKELRRNGND